MRSFIGAFLLVYGLLVAGGANAGRVAVTFAQVGSDVVVTAAGSLSATTGAAVAQAQGQVYPSQGYVSLAGLTLSPIALASCTVSPTSGFGTGGAFYPTAFSGDLFVLFAPGGSNNSFYLPPNFPGGNISSTMTLGNTQLSSLGLTSGGVTYTCGADTITVNVPTPSPSAVPTLSEWSQMLLALMVMTVIGWHFYRERGY